MSSYLSAMRSSLTSYFTPKKARDDQTRSREKDRKLMPPPPITRPLRLDHNSKEMSPLTKTSNWLAQGLPSPSSSRSASPNTSSFNSASKPPQSPIRSLSSNSRTVLSPQTSGSRVSKSPPVYGRAKAFSVEDENYQPDRADDHYSDDELDGPTLVFQESATRHAPVTAAPHSSVKKKKKTRRYYPEDSDEEEEGTIIIKRGSKNEVLAEQSLERARRVAESLRLPENQHWSQAEKDLFRHLALRGFEPLIPKSWSRDFGTFPDALFSEHDNAVIHNLNGSSFRAIHAFRTLVRLGPSCRDKLILKLRPEPFLFKTLKDYLRWSFEDGELDKYPSSGIPVHSIVSQKQGQNRAETVKRLANKLHGLAGEWREAWALSRDRTAIELPVLTGILIIHSLVAVVTLDPNTTSEDSDPSLESGQVHQLIVIDFGHAPYDVWNAFAFAIVTMHIRKIRLAYEDRAERAAKEDVGINI